MKKHNKIVEKALKALNFTWNEELGFSYFDEKDVKVQLGLNEMKLREYEDRITEIEGYIEIAKNNIENHKLMLRQIEIEEYKELNPHAKDIF